MTCFLFHLVPAPGPPPPDEEKPSSRRNMAPMTKDEYEKRQSKVRRVLDPDTGRHR